MSTDEVMGEHVVEAVGVEGVRRRGLPVWIKLLVPLAALPFLILLGYGFRTSSVVPSPLVRKEAPAFALQLYGDGSRLSLAELRGKPVVVNFWASWCIPCRQEARLLEQGWQAYRSRGAVFVGVNIQDRLPAALAFIREFGKTYPIGPDPDGRISIDYGVYGVPETFFVDKQGRVSYKQVGPLTPEVLKARVEEIL
jgi:cytochrome c biogenesis protein CcmG/thiol:disulfide interchange protein DsbE